MSDDERQIEQLFQEATRKGYTRRQVMKRGAALGLSIPAIKSVLAAGAFAQDAPPPRRPPAGRSTCRSSAAR